MLILVGSSVRAAPAAFAIDLQQTTLSLSGQIDGSSILMIAPGSLDNRYGNPSAGHRLSVDLQPASIQFNSFDNALNAMDLRQFDLGVGYQWVQAAHVAGGFSGLNTGPAKFYDFGLDLNFGVSGSIPVAGGQFPATAVTFRPGGVINISAAFNSPYHGTGDSIPFLAHTANAPAAPGTLTSHHGRLTLTLPIDYSRAWTAPGTGLAHQLRWTGQLVAYHDQPITPDTIADLPSGQSVTRGVGGGAAQVGGVQVAFPLIAAGGEFSAIYSTLSPQQASEQFHASIDFMLASDPLQVWEIGFTGSFSGPAQLMLRYADAGLLVPESQLAVYHQGPGGAWTILPTLNQDSDANTITVLTDSFSPFALGATVPEPAMGTLTLAGSLLLLRRR